MKTYKVELTEEFIKEAHQSACDEWKTKIKDLVPEAFEDEFIIGNWYKGFAGGSLVNYQGGKSGYGINSRKEWVNNNSTSWTFLSHPKNWKPDTDKEVEEALIKEAKKRGLVKGAEVFSLRGYRRLILTDKYLFTDGRLYSDNGTTTIFENGKWAKPIEDNTEKRKRNYILQKIEEMENQLNELKKEL